MPGLMINTAKVRRAVRAAFGPAAIGLLEASVRHRSWSNTQQFGRRIGAFGFRHHKRYRTRAMTNLRYAFGDELSDGRVAEIVQASLEHHAMLFLEALRMPSMPREELMSIVDMQGLEHVDAALEAGRGAVMFSAHFGNWEIGAVRAIYGGLPLLPLSRPPRSPRLAKSLKSIRDKLNFPVIPVTEGVKGIMRALKQNQLVPVMPDRFAWGKGLTVPFFGKPTHVWHTPAMMAQRAKCPIIPTHAIRQPDGTYIVEVDPPIEQHHSEDREFDVWVTTARCMDMLGQKIRLHPEQFPWHYLLWRPGYEYDPPYPFERLEGLL